MAFSLLDQLPSEIIIQIFKSIDDFSTLVSLICTSPTLYAVWQLNMSSICTAVLPKTIDCFDDAQELVKTQELISEQPQNLISEKYNRAADILKRFRSNAHAVSLASDIFQAHFRYCENTRNELSLMTLTPSERIRFTHAFYRVWTITILVQQGSVSSQRLKSLLTSLSAREIFRIQEVALWLATQCPRKNLQDLSMATFKKEPGGKYTPGLNELWIQGFEAIQEEFNKDRFAKNRWPLPQCALGMFAVFDEWQGDLKELPEMLWEQITAWVVLGQVESGNE